MAAAAPQGGTAYITFLTGPLAGKSFALSQRVTSIGGAASDDIPVLGDPPLPPAFVRLARGDSVWRLEKTANQAGVVTLNGDSVESGALREGAVIGLGTQTTLRFSLKPVKGAQPPRKANATATPGGPPASRASVANDPSEQTLVRPRGSLTGRSTSTPRSSQASQAAQPQPARPSQPQLERTQAVSSAALVKTQVAHEYLEIRSSHGRAEHQLGDVTDIGRDPANDIVLEERIVSGRHLRITREGGKLTLHHPHPDRTQTLNGLLYQGRQIAGDERFAKVLENGDVFRIGSEDGTIITLTYYDGSGIPQALTPVQPIKLGAQLLSIGRTPENQIVLDHPQVSARHALLVREEGSYRLLDQHSTNHVYVNGEPVTNRLLALGDEIRIGPYRLVYSVNELTQYDESKFISIVGMNLTKTGINGAVLLSDISINIPPRQFVALVGGSGAGKSTLMDALNGTRPATGGHVLYNGQDFYAHRAEFSNQLGYVPQDDIVHRDLTVERALYYAAKLRLPADFTEEQIERRISEVLDDVEMTARRSLLVKRLSGGQRKRVSIALELLGNPSVFFLDEPTSGLDPGLDRKMMYLLRKLADKGHTIVLVTHATNNIKVCDHICFLAQGGRVTFFGPPDEAMTYFGTDDFAEIYTQLEPTDEQPTKPADAEARFRASETYQTYIAQPLKAQTATLTEKMATAPATSATSATSATPEQAAAPLVRLPERRRQRNPFVQFALLFRRNVELLVNDRANLALLVLQAPLMALLILMLVRFEIGTGIFNTDQVVQCAPMITQHLVTVPPSDTNPTGIVQIGINTSSAANPNAAVDCGEIQRLLRGDTTSQADAQMRGLAQQYASKRGGVAQALQDFIVAGNAQNTLTAVFLIGFLAMLFGCINGTREIVKEASIYRRERAVNLGIVPYVLSKVGILGIFAVFQSIVLLVMVQIFEPFQTSVFLPPLLEVFVTLLLVALTGLLTGLVVSAAAGSEDRANSLLPMVLIPPLVFAGSMFPLKDQILQVIGLLFPMRWAMVALGTTVGMHSDKINGDALLGDNTAYRSTLYSTFTQNEAMQRLYLAWGALALISLVLIVAICLFMRRMDVGRPERPRGSLSLANLSLSRLNPARLNLARKPAVAPGVEVAADRKV